MAHSDLGVWACKGCGLLGKQAEFLCPCAIPVMDKERVYLETISETHGLWLRMLRDIREHTTCPVCESTPCRYGDCDK